MEPDIRDIMRIARRRGWIVMAATVLGGLLLLLAGLVQDEKYAADARLLVLPAGGAEDSYNALLTSQSLTETYRQMMESEPMFARVIETLGLDHTLIELDRKVTSAVLPGALLIEVTIEDENPEQAALIATTFVEQFVDYHGEIAQVDSEGGGLSAEVEVSDPATVPEDPVSPNVPFLVVLGCFGGFLLGIGAVIVLELRSALRRAEHSPPEPATRPEPGRQPG